MKEKIFLLFTDSKYIMISGDYDFSSEQHAQYSDLLQLPAPHLKCPIWNNYPSELYASYFGLLGSQAVFCGVTAVLCLMTLGNLSYMVM